MVAGARSERLNARGNRTTLTAGKPASVRDARPPVPETSNVEMLINHPDRPTGPWLAK
jgi:hypothetical protein